MLCSVYEWLRAFELMEGEHISFPFFSRIKYKQLGKNNYVGKRLQFDWLETEYVKFVLIILKQLWNFLWGRIDAWVAVVESSVFFDKFVFLFKKLRRFSLQDLCLSLWKNILFVNRKCYCYSGEEAQFYWQSSFGKNLGHVARKSSFILLWISIPLVFGLHDKDFAFQHFSFDAWITQL